MSGRKQKTERKRTARPKKVVEVPVTEPQVFFEDVLLAFLREVGKAVGEIKGRGGAQRLGPDGMFACAVEALDQAQNSGNPRGHISGAAYALVAAMQQARVWGLPLKPAPEQPPESPQTSPEPPEEVAK